MNKPILQMEEVEDQLSDYPMAVGSTEKIIAEDVLKGKTEKGNAKTEPGISQHAVPITSMVFSVLLLTSSVILLTDVIESQRIDAKCNAVVLNDVLLTSAIAIAIATSQFFCSLLKMKEMTPGGQSFNSAHIIFTVILGFTALTAYTGGIYKYGNGLLFMHTSVLDFIACMACTL